MSNREAVPIELSEPESCVSSVQSAFGSLRVQQTELTGFFDDAFNQLEALSLELLARHKCLELSTQHRAEQEAAGGEHERRFGECLEEVRKLGAEVRSSHEEAKQVWAEVSAAHQKLLQDRAGLHETREEARRISTAFSALH